MHACYEINRRTTTRASSSRDLGKPGKPDNAKLNENKQTRHHNVKFKYVLLLKVLAKRSMQNDAPSPRMTPHIQTLTLKSC